MKNIDKNFVGISLLSFDLYNILKIINDINKTDCDYLHLDVMDGVLVPNISPFSPSFIKNLRPHTNKLFDVHLMIIDPMPYIQNFIDAGADKIWIHVESKNALKSIKKLFNLGIWCGVVLNIKSSASKIKKFLPYINGVMVMTVNAGFGGQKFNYDMLCKISDVRRIATKFGKEDILIQVDGGINLETLYKTKQSNANSFAIGSFMLSSKNMGTLIKKLKSV